MKTLKCILIALLTLVAAQSALAQPPADLSVKQHTIIDYAPAPRSFFVCRIARWIFFPVWP